MKNLSLISVLFTKETVKLVFEAALVFACTIALYFIDLGLILSIIFEIIILIFIYVLDHIGVFNKIFRTSDIYKKNFRKMDKREKLALINQFQEIVTGTKFGMYYFGRFVPVCLLLENTPELNVRIQFDLTGTLDTHKNYFVRRYCESKGCDSDNTFSNSEVEKYLSRIGVELANDEPSVWMTDMSIEEHEKTSTLIQISLMKITYRPKFLLNWHLDYKFVREPDFPLKIVTAALEELSKSSEPNKLELKYLNLIPANTGVNISIITSDNKFVITRRSGKEAVMRFMWQQGVSGAFDFSDFETGEAVYNGAFREMFNEMRIEKEDVEFIKILGIANRVENNIIDFFLVCKTSLSLEDLKKNRKNKGSPEHWENESIRGFDPEEIATMSGKWRAFYNKNYKFINTQLLVSLALYKHYHDESRNLKS
ncbi:MAG: hypothetical protein QXX11_04990 [Thermoplasmata archaeon]